MQCLQAKIIITICQYFFWNYCNIFRRARAYVYGRPTYFIFETYVHSV